MVQLKEQINQILRSDTEKNIVHQSNRILITMHFVKFFELFFKNSIFRLSLWQILEKKY